MSPKSEQELVLAKRLKVLRTIIRLKHSLAADDELRQAIELETARFNRALLSGQKYGFKISSLMERNDEPKKKP